MNEFARQARLRSDAQLLSIKPNKPMKPTESHLDIILAINHWERTLSHGWQYH